MARKKKISDLASAFVSIMGNGSPTDFGKPETPALTLDVKDRNITGGCKIVHRDGLYVISSTEKTVKNK